ncbi:MAG: low molecular weight phosphotyrosine protein phosphatase [Clostridia bacterium]|nr:low molecular weight phosphotyrosine protein phosphatase [Clostridia bacterium]
MIKILFVCHGNICRSPMAEYIMKHLVHEARLDARFEIASAATSYEEIGNPVYPSARRELARHGIGCEGHHTRHLERADYDEYDLLIGMEQVNLRNMRRICGGDALGKMHLLLEYTDFPGDIEDPWYSGRFEKVYTQIESGCKALLTQLTERA